MNIQKYLVFLRVAEVGSFTRVAEEFNYSQPNISLMINQLEKEWNVQLFHRNRHKVESTKEAYEILPYVRKVCESYWELHTKIDRMQDVHPSVIRIGTFPSIAGTWLPGIIRDFTQDHPDIEFDVLMGDYQELTDMLINDQIDCAFLSAPDNESLPINFTFICNDHYVVLLSEDSPLNHYDRIPLSVLSTEPMILLEKNGLEEEIFSFFTQYAVHPHVKFRAWDNNAIMSLVESGLGIGILSTLMVQRSAYRISIKELEVPAFRKIGYCTKSAEDITPLVRTFLSYVPR